MTDWPKKILEVSTGWRLETFEDIASKNQDPEARFILGIQSSFGLSATFYLGRDVSEFDQIVTNATDSQVVKVMRLDDNISSQYITRAIPVIDYLSQRSGEIRR